MTREEAKQIIVAWLATGQTYQKGQCGYIEGWFYEKDAEAFRMAIEALEQEPSEDCISRKALLEQIRREYGSGWQFVDIIENAPSVVPSEKHGKWLRYCGDIWVCSACGESLMCDDIECNNYCPNCKAKMEVDEETERKTENEENE